MTLNTTIQCRRDLRNARRTISFLPTLQDPGDTPFPALQGVFVGRLGPILPLSSLFQAVSAYFRLSHIFFSAASASPREQFFISAFRIQPSAFISDTLQTQKTHTSTQKTQSSHKPDTIENISKPSENTFPDTKNTKKYFSCQNQ